MVFPLLTSKSLSSTVTFKNILISIKDSRVIFDKEDTRACLIHQIASSVCICLRPVERDDSEKCFLAKRSQTLVPRGPLGPFHLRNSREIFSTVTICRADQLTYM